MGTETPPLGERYDVLLKVIELLTRLDAESQLRTLRAAAIFLGFEVGPEK